MDRQTDKTEGTIPAAHILLGLWTLLLIIWTLKLLWP